MWDSLRTKRERIVYFLVAAFSVLCFLGGAALSWRYFDVIRSIFKGHVYIGDKYVGAYHDSAGRLQWSSGPTDISGLVALALALALSFVIAFGIWVLLTNKLILEPQTRFYQAKNQTKSTE